MLPLSKIIHYFFSAYTALIVARIVGSWIPSFSLHKLMFFLRACTDPYLNVFRRLIPPIGGMLDLSPVLGFFVLEILEKFLLRLLA